MRILMILAIGLLDIGSAFAARDSLEISETFKLFNTAHPQLWKTMMDGGPITYIGSQKVHFGGYGKTHDAWEYNIVSLKVREIEPRGSLLIRTEIPQGENMIDAIMINGITYWLKPSTGGAFVIRMIHDTGSKEYTEYEVHGAYLRVPGRSQLIFGLGGVGGLIQLFGVDPDQSDIRFPEGIKEGKRIALYPFMSAQIPPRIKCTDFFTPKNL